MEYNQEDMDLLEKYHRLVGELPKQETDLKWGISREPQRYNQEEHAQEYMCSFDEELSSN